MVRVPVAHYKAVRYWTVVLDATVTAAPLAAWESLKHEHAPIHNIRLCIASNVPELVHALAQQFNIKRFNIIMSTTRTFGIVNATIRHMCTRDCSWRDQPAGAERAGHKVSERIERT